MDARFVTLARVVRTHGLKGEVSVEPVTGLPFDFLQLPTGLRVWFVPPPMRAREGAVESVRPGPKGPLVKVSAIDDVDAASELVGAEMMARPEDLPDGWADIEEPDDPVGMKVVDVERGDLGEVAEVIETGANDVWIVRGSFGEVLVPVIDDVVVGVDREARLARVRLLPGLLE